MNAAADFQHTVFATLTTGTALNVNRTRSNHATLRAAMVRDLIATVQKLETLEHAARTGSTSTWGDLTPARLLLESREQELQEQLSVMDNAMREACAHPHRLQGSDLIPPQLPWWKFAAGVAILVAGCTGFALHAAGVLFP